MRESCREARRNFSGRVYPGSLSPADGAAEMAPCSLDGGFFSRAMPCCRCTGLRRERLGNPDRRRRGGLGNLTHDCRKGNALRSGRPVWKPAAVTAALVHAKTCNLRLHTGAVQSFAAVPAGRRTSFSLRVPSCRRKGKTGLKGHRKNTVGFDLWERLSPASPVPFGSCFDLLNMFPKNP